MNRILLAALAVGAVFLFTDSASAQYRRGCAVRGVAYTTPYYTYRSYGPGTHISRYAPQAQVVRRNHKVTRSTHYRLPSTYSRSIYHTHPHLHRVPYGHPYNYPYNYGRGGLSFSIGF